jgi:hypothetical protein
MGTIWNPDTCTPPGCRVDVTNWETNPPTMTVLSKCPAHAAVADGDLPAALHGSAGENRRKNVLLARINDTISPLNTVERPTSDSWLITLANGNTALLTWTGSGASRVLNVVSTGFTAIQRTSAQAYCDTTFGVGTVVIT